MPKAPTTHRPAHYRTRQQRTASFDRYRKSSSDRGYDHTWNKYSAWFRQQPEHAVCAICQRKATNCVDHIIPHNGRDDVLFEDANNHWGLCTRCHAWKTAKFDGGYGHAMVVVHSSAAGIEARRMEIVRRFKEANL